MELFPGRNFETGELTVVNDLQRTYLGPISNVPEMSRTQMHDDIVWMKAEETNHTNFEVISLKSNIVTFVVLITHFAIKY